jgi:hypothetical protein
VRLLPGQDSRWARALCCAVLCCAVLCCAVLGLLFTGRGAVAPPAIDRCCCMQPASAQGACQDCRGPAEVPRSSPLQASQTATWPTSSARRSRSFQPTAAAGPATAPKCWATARWARQPPQPHEHPLLLLLLLLHRRLGARPRCSHSHGGAHRAHPPPPAPAQAYLQSLASKYNSSSPSYNGSSYGPPASNASSKGRHLLAPYGAAEPQCVAGTPYQQVYGECNDTPGYMPLITINGLHQVGPAGGAAGLLQPCVLRRCSDGHLVETC